MRTTTKLYTGASLETNRYDLPRRMRSCASRCAVLVGAIVLLAVGGAGCSSTTNVEGAKCGEGTVPRDGECVAADGGATEAATSIDATIDATVDATIDATVGDAVDHADGEVGISDATNGTDVSVDAVDAATEEGGATWTDDPCAPKTSYDCDFSRQARCEPGSSCFYGCPGGVYPVPISSPSFFPLVLRLPPVASSTTPDGGACAGKCTDGTKLAFALPIALPADSSRALRVTVGAPWKIFASSLDSGHQCLSEGASLGCLMTRIDYVYVAIATDDPNAPARNVTVELVPSTATCP